jgi:hypothetical protein
MVIGNKTISQGERNTAKGIFGLKFRKDKKIDTAIVEANLLFCVTLP